MKKTITLQDTWLFLIETTFGATITVNSSPRNWDESPPEKTGDSFLAWLHELVAESL